MELVEGQSLASLVTPGGLPLSRFFELSIPLGDALAAAHERGVVHRDLKPGNVMVMRQDRVKVLDFGLARIAGAKKAADAATLAETVEEPISGAGEVSGTVPYMAPEQIRGETVDARTDLFALGIILYELATCDGPSTSPAATVTSSILRERRADHDFRLISRATSRVRGRCLEKSPRESRADLPRCVQ